jgi:ABC-2 type transport system ATP-binding protein
MRQRVGLAQALVNDPELVVLDEPTDGVDPVGRKEIRDVVKRLGDEGRAVLINSHLLGELEMVCDRVAILVKGVVVQHGTLDDLAVGQARYEIEMDGPPEDAAQAARRVAQAVSEMDDQGMKLATGERVDVLGAKVLVASESPGAVAPVLAEAVRQAAIIRSVRPTRPSLEDLFMQAVTDPDTGKALTPGADRKRQPDREGGAA